VLILGMAAAQLWALYAYGALPDSDWLPAGASANNWNIAFLRFGLAYTVGGLCWIALDPIRRLDRPAKA
jgi:hypothetical protein